MNVLHIITDKNGNERIVILDSYGRPTFILLKPEGIEDDAESITQFEIGYGSTTNNPITAPIFYILDVNTGRAVVYIYSSSTSGGSLSATSGGYLRKVDYVHVINMSNSYGIRAYADASAKGNSTVYTNIECDLSVLYTYFYDTQTLETVYISDFFMTGQRDENLKN